MAAASDLGELRERFAAAGQEHVFRFWDAGLVPEEQKARFVAQLTNLDLVSVHAIYDAATKEAAATDAAELSPPDAFTSLSQCTAEAIGAWEAEGFAAIGRGEVAACVLAGGQASRLGCDVPKGAYDIGLPSHKPLFQFMVERILRLISLAKAKGFASARLPLLVMTSPMNTDTTRSFFEKNSFFGMAADQVRFFEQGTLPCMTVEGKIILESAGVVASNPDGNGGIYPALLRSGTMEWLKVNGYKYFHAFSVDNSLCRPADPCFVGFCIKQGADIGNKCVWKTNPEEKVGVVAKKGDKAAIVEYSEIDEVNKNRRDADGKLLFGAGNICNHFFSIDFLDRRVMPNLPRLFHLAHKKIPYAGEDGQTVKPDANNGIKLEAFIFDTFPMSERMAVLEAARHEEFAPVKNAPGSASDTPESACTMVSELCKAWVRRAGGEVAGPAEELFEISPLLSYAGEGLEDQVRGKTFTAPMYLH